MNDCAAYDVIDHVYLGPGANEVARDIRSFQSGAGCATYAFVDEDLRYVHEDYRHTPFAVEGKNQGGLVWEGEISPFGITEHEGLPGTDGKIGTSDDLPYIDPEYFGLGESYRDDSVGNISDLDPKPNIALVARRIIPGEHIADVWASTPYQMAPPAIVGAAATSQEGSSWAPTTGYSQLGVGSGGPGTSLSLGSNPVSGIKGMLDGKYSSGPGDWMPAVTFSAIASSNTAVLALAGGRIKGENGGSSSASSDMMSPQAVCSDDSDPDDDDKDSGDDDPTPGSGSSCSEELGVQDPQECHDAFWALNAFMNEVESILQSFGLGLPTCPYDQEELYEHGRSELPENVCTEPGVDVVTNSPPAQQLIYLAHHPKQSDSFNVDMAGGGASASAILFSPGRLTEPGDQQGVAGVHAVYRFGGGDP